MKRFLSFLIAILLSFSSAWAEGNYASQSVLSSGRWVKIKVTKNGVYKLTASDLNKMGFSDPSKVSVYGYGGWILDEQFSDSAYHDDLPAVPVWRDGSTLYFYARGTVKWSYENKLFVHTNNPYATAGYYFVTDATDTHDMPEQASVEGAVRQISTFDDYQVWEKDEVAVNESGRELFGESFISTTTRNFTFSVPGITSDDAEVSMRFIARTTGRTPVTLTVGDAVLSLSISAPTTNASYTKAVVASGNVTWKGEKNESVKMEVTYGKTGDQNVYLDYIRFQMKRALKLYGAETAFRSVDAINNVSRFELADASESTIVLDVTDVTNPKRMQTTLNGTNLSFTAAASSQLREYIAFDKNKLTDTPEIVGEVSTQNLHGLETPNMVIIVPTAFTTQAQRLAEIHRQRNGLTVEVINPEPIYNEFSSGTPDATAYRRLLKMFYDRKPETLKYLLLFGDGCYDNRGLTREWQQNSSLLANMLLTYQSQNSIDIYSYMTDDYFGFLEDGSGASLASAKLCVGIGRFPIRTNDEAKAAVDKIISYMDNTLPGNWKNNITFVADDGSNADPDKNIHMRQANEAAAIIEENHPEFKVNKLFFDAYTKDRTGGNASYPDVEAALQKQLKNGLMVLNYTGHGNTTSWSDEAVMTQSYIQQATYPYLPLWITATCDFTRFDALATSAGESVFLNEKSGGIALFTTTRAVFSQDNAVINQVIIRNLFSREGNRRYTLGEIMMKAKQSMGYDSNKLNFTLIGDPALTLTFPDYSIAVTEINGKPVDSSEDITIKALERVTIKGEVRKPDGTKDSAFTGPLQSTIFDSKATITTLDNFSTGTKFQYEDYPNTLYIGNDSVRNGEFSFSFTVPKDIAYSNDFGKMNFYAFNNQDSIEAQGSFLDFRVGGTSDTGGDDTEGPEIRYLYLNDTTFVDGGQVNSTPLFVASLWDKSGINITGSSIGHDMMLIIDNQTSKSYNLNDYYQLVGSDGAGQVIFSIPELEPGLHTAEFKVWDVLNNSTTQTFTFEVVKDMKPNLISVFATPIPAREKVTFHLKHNFPESKLTVKIEVYDMAGRLRWSHEESGSSEAFKNYQLEWNLMGNGNTRLRPGVYIYRASLRSGKSKTATGANKMIILAQ